MSLMNTDRKQLCSPGSVLIREKDLALLLISFTNVVDCGFNPLTRVTRGTGML